MTININIFYYYCVRNDTDESSANKDENWLQALMEWLSSLSCTKFFFNHLRN